MALCVQNENLKKKRKVHGGKKMITCQFKYLKPVKNGRNKHVQDNM